MYILAGWLISDVWPILTHACLYSPDSKHVRPGQFDVCLSLSGFYIVYLNTVERVGQNNK